MNSKGEGTKGNLIKDFEGELIRIALQETHGNREKAARLLGISTTTLWRKVKELDDISK